jgi:Tfp pilus assembly protein PilV
MKKKIKTKASGFTLVELVVAMMILMTAVLGGLLMILMGVTRNNTNRVDTTATNVAQAVIEQVSGAPTNKNPVLTMTDCLQTDPALSTLKINTAPGGATLQANGDIDFNADDPVTLNGQQYQMNFTVCANNNAQSTQTVYDVRWSIQAVGAGGWGKLVTVSARQPFVASQQGIAFIRPITLRTIVSM